MVSRVLQFPILQETAPLEPGPTERLLLLGTCTVGPLLSGLTAAGFRAEHLLHESYSYSLLPKVDMSEYDAIVVSLTVRHILVEAAYYLERAERPGNCIYLARAIASGRQVEFFEKCAELLAAQVRQICSEFSNTLLFFTTFIEPMHNYLGNLLPRYSLKNPAYFIRKLNEAMEESLEGVPWAHLLDLNEIIGLLGKLRIQDDYVAQISHGSLIGDDIFDEDRIQQSTQPTKMYDSDGPLKELGTVFAQRIRDDLSVLRNPLQTKVIIVDLDDTLWRGVHADQTRPHPELTEGWPLGLAEALLIFRARGGLLAICSKNDEAETEAKFNEIFCERLSLKEFACVRINRTDKATNVRFILDSLGLLPEHALFIDDNPREVDIVRAAFPAMKFLSGEHYDWRRKILMSPAMQVASISAEGRRRTELIQAKVLREQSRERLSRGDWLSSLQLVQTYSLIKDIGHPSFERAFELLNKTNQFNTTGRRWDRSELPRFFHEGGYFVATFLRDRIVDNGLIGLGIVRAETIEQVVLSCRVFGLDVEYALGHVLCRLILKNHSQALAPLKHTDRNALCREYFQSLGFVLAEDTYSSATAPHHPSHISSEFAGLFEPEELRRLMIDRVGRYGVTGP